MVGTWQNMFGITGLNLTDTEILVGTFGHPKTLPKLKNHKNLKKNNKFSVNISGNLNQLSDILKYLFKFFLLYLLFGYFILFSGNFSSIF